MFETSGIRHLKQLVYHRGNLSFPGSQGLGSRGWLLFGNPYLAGFCENEMTLENRYELVVTVYVAFHPQSDLSDSVTRQNGPRPCCRQFTESKCLGVELRHLQIRDVPQIILMPGEGRKPHRLFGQHLH